MSHSELGDGVGTDADNINTASLTGQTLTIAVETESGDVNILNVGSLTVGTVDALSGVTITDADTDDTGNDNITLIASSPLTVNQSITNADGGNITLTATNDGGGDDDLTISANVTATGGDGAIDLNAGTDLIVNNDVVVSTVGAGNITGDAVRAIDILSNAATTTIQSVSGNITLTANRGGAAVTGDFTGISIDDAIVTATTGNISLDGRSGDSSNDGIALTSGTVVSTTGAGSGTITFDGDGVSGGGDGIFIDDAGTLVTSVDGNIILTGDGVDADGVGIRGGAVVSSTGNATITLIGNGEVDGVFINTTGSQVTSVTGDISITGTSTDNDGVAIADGGAVVSTGTALITIFGTANNASASDGVEIEGGSISSGAGDILITGLSSSQHGIKLEDGGVVASTGTASITFNGTTTGDDGSDSDGILIRNADTRISSTGGSISLTGIASGGTAGDGVEIESGVTLAIDANGAADLTVTGTGDGVDAGVQIDSPINSEAGFVTIRSEDGGSTTDDITFGAGGRHHLNERADHDRCRYCRDVCRRVHGGHRGGLSRD